MKKIIVVGSQGFIGMAACKYFKGNKFEVYEADIFPTNETNYFQINTENPDFYTLFQQKQFDYCINASGASNVTNSVSNPYADYHQNTYVYFRILDAVRLHNPTCKVLNLSSAAVYGNPKKLPILENAKLKPLSPYGFHKLQCEIISKEFYELYKIKSINLRIFSVYGVGAKKQLFWDVATKMHHSNKIELFGTGDETRDFIYITDLIQCFHLLIDNCSFRAQSLNIANGKQTTTKDAANYLKNYLKWNGEINFTGENRKGDPKNWEANIEKLKNLGYQQKIKIEQGIELYAKWIKENQ